MPDLLAIWKQWVVELEFERNELRMEAQLASAGARDSMHEVERLLEDFRQRGHFLKGVRPDQASGIVAAGAALAADLRERFARIRQLLERDGLEPAERPIPTQGEKSRQTCERGARP